MRSPQNVVHKLNANETLESSVRKGTAATDISKMIVRECVM